MRNFEMLMENTRSDFILLIKSQLKHKSGVEMVEKIIKIFFKAMQQTLNVEEIDFIFNNLDNIQYVLSEAFYVDDIKITQFLKDFISDFDRVDDEEWREVLYKKIKETSF